MTKLLMCPPVYFNVEYTINPWMNNNIRTVDKKLAHAQWQDLYSTLINNKVDVDLIHPINGLPDMVFTANAGYVEGDIFYSSKFIHKERSPEEEHWMQYFSDKSYKIKYFKEYFEGEGDCLRDFNGGIWFGHGYRSEKSNSILSLELIDPRWYHLDTAFCPLPDHTIMWYPYAFSNDSRQLIKDSFQNHIVVDDEDAASFACNAIVIDNCIYIPKNKNTSDKLRKLGYTVYEFDMSEFMKAGGACKCLVLFLER